MRLIRVAPNPQPDGLVVMVLRVLRHSSAWRTSTLYVELRSPYVKSFDRKPLLLEQIALSDLFNCDLGEVATINHAAIRDNLHYLIRSMTPLQRCTKKSESASTV
jgi:hypothetical protein